MNKQRVTRNVIRLLTKAMASLSMERWLVFFIYVLLKEKPCKCPRVVEGTFWEVVDGPEEGHGYPLLEHFLPALVVFSISFTLCPYVLFVKSDFYTPFLTHIRGPHRLWWIEGFCPTDACCRAEMAFGLLKSHFSHTDGDRSSLRIWWPPFVCQSGLGLLGLIHLIESADLSTHS